MITSGSSAKEQAGVQEVAEQTLQCLKANVPDNLPGITFLSEVNQILMQLHTLMP